MMLTNRNHKPLKRIALSLAALALLCACAGCSSEAAVKQAQVYVSEEKGNSSVGSADTAGANAASASSISFAEQVSPSAGSSRGNVSGDPSATEILPDTVAATGNSGDQKAAGNSADQKAGGNADASVAQSTTGKADTAADNKDYIEILFLGDSQYTNAQGSGTEIPALVAGEVDSSLCRVYNLAISGTTATLPRSEKEMKTDAWTSNSFIGMAHVLNGDVSPDFLKEKNPSIVQTLKKLDPKKIDYVVLDYGTNDFLNARQLSDEDEPDNPCSFGGAYDTGLRILRHACPDATIICCSPCYSVFYGQDGSNKGDGNSLNNGYGVLANYVGLVDAISDNHEQTFFMDMYHGEWIDLDFYSEKDYLSDGIHLTARGRRTYAAAVGKVINKLRGAIETIGETERLEDH